MKRDKIWVIALIILFFLLVIKSFFIDGYMPTKEEEPFYHYVESIIKERYDGLFIKTRIVKIKKLTEKEKVYYYKDVKVKTEGEYKAKIRKYLFGLIPFSEETILEGVK